MSLTEKLEKRAYPAILAFVVLMAASIQMKIVFGMEFNRILLLPCCLLLIAGIFLVDYFGKYREFRVAAGLLALLAVVLILYNREAVWEYVKQEENIWFVGIVIVIGVALYISQQFFTLRVVVCIGYWGAMLFLLCINLFPIKSVMFYLTAELILVLMEMLNRKSNAGKLVCMMPVVCITVLLLLVLPYSEQPLNWRAVYDWVVDLLDGKELPQINISNEKVGFVGYSENVNLHGNKVDISRETLKITMLGNKEHIYLAGTVKNTYTGDGWIGTLPDRKYQGNFKEYQLDAAELLYAMYRAEIIVPSKYGENDKNVWYLRYRELTVEYDGMRSASLFRPSKTALLTPIKYEGELIDSTEDIGFSKRQKADTSYTLGFFSINRSWREARKLINEQSQYVYDTLSEEEYKKFRQEVKSDYGAVILPDTEDFEKELKERAEYIRANYLEVPTDIVERMTWLAGEIVEGCETDYDKMERIVRYLSYYTYTKTPGIVPVGKDVVEYFLFETGKGYCTHFASAAALLGRCVGIPTRLVQGYLLDADLAKQFGEYTVNEMQAHAWLECYFEGVGWLIFDPTPGNEDMLYQDWEIPSHISQTGGNYKPVNPDGSIDETTTEDETSESETDEDESFEDETSKDKTTDTTTAASDNSAGDKPKTMSEAQKRAIITCLIIVGTVVLVVAVKEAGRRSREAFWNRYEKAPYGDRVKTDMILILWILKKEGHPIEGHETLTEYIDRISVNYSEKAELLAEVCGLYQKARYGDKRNITEEEHQKSQRLRVLFMSEKYNKDVLARYGRKFL